VTAEETLTWAFRGAVLGLGGTLKWLHGRSVRHGETLAALKQGAEDQARALARIDANVQAIATKLMGGPGGAGG
jgi:hypothetical protein